MPTKLKIFAIAAALAAGTSSAAMAQYACPAGYAFYNGVCQPVVAAPAYPSGPLSGAAAGGPIGAIIGGALGTATGAVAGTANMLTGAPPAVAPPPVVAAAPPAPVCYPGYIYYNGACYPKL